MFCVMIMDGTVQMQITPAHLRNTHMGDSSYFLCLCDLIIAVSVAVIVNNSYTQGQGHIFHYSSAYFQTEAEVRGGVNARPLKSKFY